MANTKELALITLYDLEIKTFSQPNELGACPCYKEAESKQC